MSKEQFIEDRESLMFDLVKVIEMHKTDDTSLLTTDVIGILEGIKLEIYISTRNLDDE